MKKKRRAEILSILLEDLIRFTPLMGITEKRNPKLKDFFTLMKGANKGKNVSEKNKHARTKKGKENKKRKGQKLLATCLKISSSSRRRRSSTCRRPLSSASRMRRCRSASMEKAWMRRSSCRRISSLPRKSNMSPRLPPSTRLSASSTSDSCNRHDQDEDANKADLESTADLIPCPESWTCRPGSAPCGGQLLQLTVTMRMLTSSSQLPL